MKHESTHAVVDALPAAYFSLRERRALYLAQAFRSARKADRGLTARCSFRPRTALSIRYRPIQVVWFSTSIKAFLDL